MKSDMESVYMGYFYSIIIPAWNVEKYIENVLGVA